MNLECLIFIGGILHLGILIASGLVPRVLDSRAALGQLPSLLRQLIWVHGAFIVLVIIGFGLLSLFYAEQLASGGALARGVCGFVALFWAARLLVQFFVFDAEPYLGRWWLRLGYHGLTVVFAAITAIYGYAALRL